MADDDDSGSAPPLTVTPAPALSSADRDMAIRTVLGEAGNDPASQAGVAAVIANRAAASGQSPTQVVLAKNQFEPWSTRSKELLAYSSDSPAYQGAAKVVDSIFSGAMPDPTGGATLFYSPTAQAAMGRPPPTWDDGSGVDLGKHRFFGGSPTVAASAPANFLTDFALARPAGLTSTSQAPSPSAAADADQTPGVSFATPDQMPPGMATSVSQLAGGHFLTDFPLAKPGALPAAAQQAPSAAASTPPIGVNDAMRAVATGLPILGGLANRGDALLDAALAPALNRFFPPNQQLQGDSFGDRYANALQQQTGMDQSFAAQHPTASNALQLGGTVLGTAAGMRQVPAAFGITSGGLGTNALLGLGGGAIMGGADAATRSDGDLNAMKWGAGAGAVLGALGPAVGAGLGRGVNALSNVVSRTTPAARNVAGVLSDIGMTPEQATNALAQMGPQATLADLDPAFTQEAGGLARRGGAPTSILKGTMNARAAGASDRINAAVDQNLGPRPDLTAIQAAYKQAASDNAAPFYDAARSSAQPMDTTPILTSIDARLRNAVGGVADTLSTAKNYLTKEVASLPGAGGNVVKMIVPKDDPQSLLSARQALDDLIERRGGSDTTAGRNALREAYNVRSQLDDLLKSDSNIAAGDQAYSAQMRNADALEHGTELFKPGVRIEDVQRDLAAMSPDQVGAMRQGVLSAIHDALDNARQGDFSAMRSLFAKSTANRAKLDALFPNAKNVLDTLGAETTMRGVEQEVARNSVTAGANAVMKKYAPQEGNALSAAPAVIGEALGGGGGALGMTVAGKAWNALANSISEGARNRLAVGTAQGLSALGPDQQAFMGQVARAYRTNSATNALAQHASTAANLLTRTGGNALMQPYLGNQAR